MKGPTDDGKTQRLGGSQKEDTFGLSKVCLREQPLTGAYWFRGLGPTMRQGAYGKINSLEEGSAVFVGSLLLIWEGHGVQGANFSGRKA